MAINYNDPWAPWSLEARKQDAESNPDYFNPDLGMTHKQVYEAMKNSGIQYSFQLAGQSGPVSRGPKTLLDNVGQYVVDAGPILAMGAGVVGAGAGAGAAGAAEGAGATGAAAGTTGTQSGLSSLLNAGVAEQAATASLANPALGAGVTEAGIGGVLASGSELGSQLGSVLGGSGGVGTPATGGASPVTAPSLSELALRGLPGALGAYASDRQSSAYSDLASEYSKMGEPYRQRLSDLYFDPESFLNSPEVQLPIQQGTNMLARSLSTKGNPFGSGNALQELQNYTTNALYSRLGQEKDRLAGFGGLTAYNQAAPGAATNAINAKGNIYAALGGAAADIFNPAQSSSLYDLYRMYYQ